MTSAGASTFNIIPFDFDTYSREIWIAMHPHRRTISAELHPDVPMLNDGEWESEMRGTNPLWETRRWIALDGPDAADTASAWFRRAGTPDPGAHVSFLNCYGSVSAPARRKGVGTLLLQEIRALMHTLDRTVLTVSAHTDPRHAFLMHFGAVAKHSMLEYRASLAGLAAQSAQVR
jgi:GNAT superfamily N-acetyltransferase